MKYTVYEIKNNINGKIYVGVHQTINIDDGYMGSGKILLRAYKKYGTENFTKTILHVFDTSVKMFSKEGKIVNEDFVDRKDTYNIRQGGFGGWDHINKKWDPELRKAKNQKAIRKAHANGMNEKGQAALKILFADADFRTEYSRNSSRKMKQFYAEGGKNGMQNKQHTPETKLLMSKAQSGKNSSSYGTCWIYNNTMSKKIQKNDLIQYLDKGWIKGRKIKF